jgi:hypothetical protein
MKPKRAPSELVYTSETPKTRHRDHAISECTQDCYDEKEDDQ